MNLLQIAGLEDLSTEEENISNPNVHPFMGEITTHSVQNTQLSRIKGRASEYYFAYRFYEWYDSENLQLIEPDLDRGWDFMIEATGKRIQVKRFKTYRKEN